jgi:hypothetical protein
MQNRDGKTFVQPSPNSFPLRQDPKTLRSQELLDLKNYNLGEDLASRVQNIVGQSILPHQDLSSTLQSRYDRHSIFNNDSIFDNDIIFISVNIGSVDRI